MFSLFQGAMLSRAPSRDASDRDDLGEVAASRSGESCYREDDAAPAFSTTRASAPEIVRRRRERDEDRGTATAANSPIVIAPHVNTNGGRNLVGDDRVRHPRALEKRRSTRRTCQSFRRLMDDLH